MRFPVLFLAAWALGFPSSWADTTEAQPDVPNPWKLGPRDQERMVFSLDRVTTVDASGETLRGFRVSGGTWDEPNGDMLYGGRGLFWARFLGGETQRMYGAGFDGGVILFPLGPTRVLFLFGLGVQHRRDPPARGYEGKGSIGAEVACWIGRKWNVAISAERDFGFSSGTRNAIGIELRWAPKVTYDYSQQQKKASN